MRGLATFNANGEVIDTTTAIGSNMSYEASDLVSVLDAYVDDRNMAIQYVSATGAATTTNTAGSPVGPGGTTTDTSATPHVMKVTRNDIAAFLGQQITYTNAAGTPVPNIPSLDEVLDNLNTRITNIGATSERLNAVTETLNVTKENLTSALSTVRDADIAEESANFVQQQILQSASATLLTQANSAPQIALTLIQG